MNAPPSESLEKLIRMANQIALAFRLEPRERALASVADHIKSFWTPKMRRDIAAHAALGGEGLDPLALAALDRLSTN